MIMIQLAKRLRELRIEKGLSQKGLADMVNVSRVCVCQWERDYCRPDYETLAVLAEIFFTTTDYLIGVTDERNRKCLTG